MDLRSVPQLAGLPTVHLPTKLGPGIAFLLAGVVIICWGTNLLSAIDIPIYRAINSFCGRYPTLDRIVLYGVELKAAIFMGTFGYLWYRRDDHVSLRRETLVITILAVPLALILNRVVSTLVPFRDRPIYAVGGNSPTIDFVPNLENWSSFPSDHATLMFAIAAGFWLVSKRSGLLFGLVGAFVALERVFVGIHYPSDMLAGALIGIGTTLAVDREPVRERAAALLALELRYPAYFYGLVFLGLTELAGGFPNTRKVAVGIVHFFTEYHKSPQQMYLPSPPDATNRVPVGAASN